MVLLAILHNLTAGILLAKVYRAMKEQKRVRKAMDATRVSREEKKGAMHLMIIFTFEPILFVLNLIRFLIFYNTRTPFMGKNWNKCIEAPCTASKKIIYGWRTEPYRRHASIKVNETS